MLPLLKKKSKHPALVVAPDWHPNFRNLERLPDTKVVRTTFFINTTAIALSLGLLLWFSYQAYAIRDLTQQIADWQRQIVANQKAAGLATAQYQKFQEAGKKITEVDAFVKTRLSPAMFLLRLGSTLPESVVLDSIELRPGGGTVRGMLTGTPERASGLASNYIEQLRADPLLGDVFNEISIRTLARDPVTGRLRFELALKIKEAKKS